MLDCKKILEGAKSELHILDLKDVEPEKIQAHLSGCMVRVWISHSVKCIGVAATVGSHI